MIVPTITIGILAVILILIGVYRGKGEHVTGLRQSLHMTIEILPLLISAFIVAGMIQVFLPQELVSRWIGSESGIRGILLGAVAGGLSPGGPYVSLPIAAGLFRAGAGAGTMVAYLTGWSLWAVARLPMEIGILGWRLTVIRVVSTAVFPPVAGLIAQILFPGPK